MPDALTHDEWLDLTLDLASAAIKDHHSRPYREAVEATRRAIRPVAGDTGVDHGRIRRRLAWFARPSDMRQGRLHGGSPEAVLFFKCAMAASGSITGHWSNMPRHERDFFSPLLAGFRRAVPVGDLAPSDPGRPSVAQFAYTWLGRSNAMGITRSLGTVRFVDVDPADAPVACRLPTVDGGDIAVRHHRGRFLRPVLAPGGWEPITPGAFAVAAREGRPWRDNPFDDASPAGQGCLGPCDYARPVIGSLSDHDEAIMRGRAASLLAGLGTLVVIDGIVHRGCGEPQAVLLDPEGWYAITWALDGLIGTTSQDTLAGNGTATIGVDPLHRPEAAEWMRVPIQEGKGLFDFREAYFAQSIGGPGTWMPLTMSASMVDPDILPPRPGAMLRAMGDYASNPALEAFRPGVATLAATARRLANQVDDGCVPDQGCLDACAAALATVTEGWTNGSGVTLGIAGRMGLASLTALGAADTAEDMRNFVP